MKRSMVMSAVAMAAMVIAGSASAKDLNGAGGTAIYPVLAKWADAYKQATGTAVNYQAIGSGGGIQQITAKTVDFANSDKPLTHADLQKINAVQFPAVIISIVPVVNIPGVKAGDLVLDGKTLADIYLGNVAYWDDAAIKKLNPNLKLPHLDISTVHRSDGSGTTFNFTNYLGKVSPEWDKKVGADTAVEWPNGVPQTLYFPGTDENVVEREMLKGSCALAYTWDGKRFRFVTDAMWRSALGMPHISPFNCF